MDIKPSLIVGTPNIIEQLKEFSQKFSSAVSDTSTRQVVLYSAKYAGLAMSAYFQPELAHLAIQEMIGDIDSLTQAGKIKKERLESYSARQTLIDILNIIEIDNLEEEKLLAIKKLFILSLQDEPGSKDEMLKKYFISICARMPLDSLMVLRAAWEIEMNDVVAKSIRRGLYRWREEVAHRLGHGLLEYVETAEIFLETERLIAKGSDQTGGWIGGVNDGRLTKTGHRLCTFLSQE
jgi:hypothetical protein